MSKKVFFVHGLNGGKKTWEHFKNIIEQDEDLKEFTLFEYSYPTILFKILPWTIIPKIQTIVDGLRSEINIKTDKQDDLILIAHSMGGLIARKYLIEEFKSKKQIQIRKVMLFATPNFGSDLANLHWLTRVVQIQQMKRNSDFISELVSDWKNFGVEKYLRVRYLAAGKDRVVDIDNAKNYWNSSDYEVIINKNHRTIIRPKSKDDTSFGVLKKFLLSKNRYVTQDVIRPEKHINRYLVRAEDYYKHSQYFFPDEANKKIGELLVEEKRIVLLSGAGEGKTEEANNLYWSFYESNLNIFPIIVRLRNYIGGQITDLFPPGWEMIPNDQLCVILDGLDEIETKHFNDATKTIESLVEKNPNSIFFITSRTNIYQTTDKELSLSGTISGFKEYYFKKIDYEEIECFAQIEFGPNAKIFLEKVNKRAIIELITIPFYLKYFVEIFKENSHLPDNICALFEALINKKLLSDKEHFRNTYNVSISNSLLLHEKIALIMEIICKNSISDEMIKDIILDSNDNELLVFSGLFYKRLNENKEFWEFEHNNFQEFLAAKMLSRYNLELIQKFIAFAPEYNKIIPSWTNTLSFLSALYPKEDLLNWLYEYQPEMLVKFEKDKIPPKLRNDIFIKIFNYYKQRKIWIDTDKYDLRELGKMASDEPTIEFLINEAIDDQDNIIRANAIMMVGFVENLNSGKREQIKQLLLKLISEHKAENLVTKSINALNNLEFHDYETINQILSSLQGHANAHTRSCIYNLIQESRASDVFVEYLLNGVQYIRTSYKEGKGSTLIDESYYLEKGLEQIESAESIKKLLEYFIINPRDLSEVSLRKTSGRFAKSISTHIIRQNEEIFELSFQLVMALGTKYFLEYTKEFIQCFELSRTELKAFKKAIEEKSDAGIKYNVLAHLANKECIDYVIGEYSSNKAFNCDVGIFRNFLGGKSAELKNYLDDRLKKETNFVFPQVIDWEGQRKKQRARDLSMFFDKDVFLKEINFVFEKENKTSFTEEELHQIVLDNWESAIYANKALDIIRNYSRDKEAKLDTIISDYLNADFDYMFINEVYQRLVYNEEFELKKEFREKIEKWCYEKVKQVEFKKALLVLPGRQFQTKTYALYTWFFMRNFELSYPENILLDMLSYSWHGAGIEYVANKLDQKKVIKRIIENFESNEENEIAIQNYFAYGFENKIKDFVYYGREYLGNDALDTSTRYTILEYLNEFDKEDEGIEKALSKTNNEFKWKMVDKLLRRKNENVKKYLLDIIRDGQDDDKLMASQYLIEMQEIEGLKYFANKVKEDNEFKLRWFRDHNSLKGLVIKEAIPYLLEMLELTYHEDFKQMEYDRLELKVFDALSNIALQSEEQYLLVKAELEKFIEEKEHISDKIRFINSFLDRVERTFYFNKSQNITLDDALEKLKLLKKLEL